MGKDKKIVQPVPETVCEPIKDWPEAERPREKLLQFNFRFWIGAFGFEKQKAEWFQLQI